MTRIVHKQVRSVQAITMFVVYIYYNNGRVFLTGETSCLLKETWGSGRWLTLPTVNSLWACRSAANPVSAKHKHTNDLSDNAVLLLFLEHRSWCSRTVICNCKKWQSWNFKPAVVALYRAEYRTLTQRSRFVFRLENIVLLVNSFFFFYIKFILFSVYFQFSVRVC